jgi:hypothetical protein
MATATDAPDFQSIIQIQYGGALTDAPDWTNVVTGPGGGAITGIADQFYPSAADFGFSGWTYFAQEISTNTVTPSSGFIYVTQFKTVATQTSTAVGFWRTSQGSGLIAAECYIAIWDYLFTSSTPLAVTASGALSAVLQAGFFPAAPDFAFTELSSPLSVQPGTIYNMVMLINGTGVPGFGATPSHSGSSNFGPPCATYKTSVGGFTSLSSNAFVADLVTTSPALWFSLGIG